MLYCLILAAIAYGSYAYGKKTALAGVDPRVHIFLADLKRQDDLARQKALDETRQKLYQSFGGGAPPQA